MNNSFKSVLIFAHPRLHHDILKPAFEEVTLTLRDLVDTIYVEQESAKTLNASAFKTIALDDDLSAIDLIIAVGGDGTLLQAGRKAAEVDIPIVGINRGKLGFLTDIKPEDIKSKLSDVIGGHYKEEERFLIEATLVDTNEQIGLGLNDIVFFAGDHMHMIELDLYINDEPFFSLKGDGLIFSTPTGSTAYSLSAGGPILYPNLNVINIVPMYPHTLSNRPIVLDGDSRIRVHVGADNTSRPRLSADGQPRNRISQGGIVEVKQYGKKLRLLHPIDYNYFETLRSKLHWQTGHK